MSQARLDQIANSLCFTIGRTLPFIYHGVPIYVKNNEDSSINESNQDKLLSNGLFDLS